jgi:hypothetical protein
MSSIEIVRCPQCGTKKSYHLGGYGFAFQTSTKCENCGTRFENVSNTIESIDPDREVHEREKNIGQKPPLPVLRDSDKALFKEAADTIETLANWHLPVMPNDLQGLIDRLRAKAR